VTWTSALNGNAAVMKARDMSSVIFMGVAIWR
jgi:hypothetical protein